jgi:hypothetical protein
VMDAFEIPIMMDMKYISIELLRGDVAIVGMWKRGREMAVVSAIDRKSTK